MVVVKLTYGLANQMFQYAAARALALRNGQPLKLDLSFFHAADTAKLAHEVYALDLFSGIFRQDVIPDNELCSIRNRYESVLPYRLLNNATKFLRLRALYAYCWEKEFLKFDPSIVQRKARTIYLTGYFQNEDYFRDYAEIIRQDFVFRPEVIDDYNRRLAEQMQAQESVAVHIRRGDYVGNRFVASLSYYEQAIGHLRAKLKYPVFYIFSDDPAWVKENIAAEANCVYVAHNTGVESYKDMYLMTQCKHNIIANSSFSWWGAWLNENKNKIVISPKEWLPEREVQAIDITPNKWLKF